MCVTKRRRYALRVEYGVTCKMYGLWASAVRENERCSCRLWLARLEGDLRRVVTKTGLFAAVHVVRAVALGNDSHVMGTEFQLQGNQSAVVAKPLLECFELLEMRIKEAGQGQQGEKRTGH